ncbi:hypothetical protein Mp_6g12690 [Marchantia polymorpha subsp. ruderalis]|uniref:Uncharacterized protein n=2 Tax=Marchantia polymorpha TaxID=3197 RepID=A0AAF6BRD3_MARPO|nr:hypothetical protein MARPO_0059s0078 [Marchantia polymorpha]BBN14567.1 hypothetical protein Mp_6g12690 [Marchantia polymorpha subsp. ruderalis]|eukprot:PTQ37152.1 hypothetical protein MARPO_0059s0078 [Marchantia polymorpha]
MREAHFVASDATVPRVDHEQLRQISDVQSHPGFLERTLFSNPFRAPFGLTLPIRYVSIPPRSRSAGWCLLVATDSFFRPFLNPIKASKRGIGQANSTSAGGSALGESLQR